MVSVASEGINGNLLSEMDTRFAADVVSHYPGFVVVVGGMNELDDASVDPQASLEASLESIAGKSVAAGITPIFCTVTSFGNHANWNADRKTWLEAWNTWLVSYCTTNSYELVDSYTLLGDPSNPDVLLAAYDLYGKHPNLAGQTVLAAGVTVALIAAGYTQ